MLPLQGEGGFLARKTPTATPWDTKQMSANISNFLRNFNKESEKEKENQFLDSLSSSGGRT